MNTRHEILHLLIALGLFAFAPTFASAAVPAFPGAQGGGAASVGGRGGAVIEVTNVNDSGTGSLRACVTASGPRTCVFRVGGTIVLQDYITIQNPFLTIAGQTAPGGGIQIRGNGIVIKVSRARYRCPLHPTSPWLGGFRREQRQGIGDPRSQRLCIQRHY